MIWYISAVVCSLVLFTIYTQRISTTISIPACSNSYRSSNNERTCNSWLVMDALLFLLPTTTSHILLLQLLVLFCSFSLPLLVHSTRTRSIDELSYFDTNPCLYLLAWMLLLSPSLCHTHTAYLSFLCPFFIAKSLSHSPFLCHLSRQLSPRLDSTHFFLLTFLSITKQTKCEMKIAPSLKSKEHAKIDSLAHQNIYVQWLNIK